MEQIRKSPRTETGTRTFSKECVVTTDDGTEIAVAAMSITTLHGFQEEHIEALRFQRKQIFLDPVPDGSVIITFDSEVTGYSCNEVFDNKAETAIYHINAWTTTWDLHFLGLVPGERSSSDSCRRLSITKAGNAHLRRLLTEAANSYSLARVGRKSVDLKQRQQGNALEVIAYADKANDRLATRSKANIAKIAVARELACFVWGMMNDQIF